MHLNELNVYFTFPCLPPTTHTEFERNAGKASYKKWRESIRILPASGATGSLLTIGDLLDRVFGTDHMRRRRRGGNNPPLMPLVDLGMDFTQEFAGMHAPSEQLKTGRGRGRGRGRGKKVRAALGICAFASMLVTWTCVHIG